MFVEPSQHVPFHEWCKASEKFSVLWKISMIYCCFAIVYLCQDSPLSCCFSWHLYCTSRMKLKKGMFWCYFWISFVLINEFKHLWRKRDIDLFHVFVHTIKKFIYYEFVCINDIHICYHFIGHKHLKLHTTHHIQCS